eukprot:5668946-Prymnesium_polylepis.1
MAIDPAYFVLWPTRCDHSLKNSQIRSIHVEPRQDELKILLKMFEPNDHCALHSRCRELACFRHRLPCAVHHARVLLSDPSHKVRKRDCLLLLQSVQFPDP